MIIDALVFLLALVILAKASHMVIKSVINLSEQLGIGEFAISFIFVAVATSLPEMLVTINAGLIGAGDIIIGNVVGSNIANTLLVVGIVAFFLNLKIRQEEITKNAAALFGISLISLLLLQLGEIGPFRGIILLGVFFAYVIIILRTKVSLGIKTPLERTVTPLQQAFSALGKLSEIWKDVLSMIIGLAALIISSYYLVNSAVNIASTLFLSGSVIGLTLIALGTSLPEIAIAAVAVIKKRQAIAIGEIFGSCIANLTLVLGTGALLTPISIGFLSIGSALIYMVIISLVLWYLISAQITLDRKIGAVFLIGYVLFILAELSLLPFG